MQWLGGDREWEKEREEMPSKRHAVKQIMLNSVTQEGPHINAITLAIDASFTFG